MQFLDLSGATTQILCERMFPWELFTSCGECFGGGLNGFAQALWQLHGSALTDEARETMMDPAFLTGRIMRHTAPNVVPVGILHFDYNMLNPWALDLGHSDLDQRRSANPQPGSARARVCAANSVVPQHIGHQCQKGAAYPQIYPGAVFSQQPD
jgi:hypothetical protein